MPSSKDWETAEHVAALLEKTLTPDARIQHNVRLPVINNPKRKRQCDVVITYGKKPRETLTIVEVQKRTRKLSVETFLGFIGKMRQVGAQHLICVSEKGYPPSVVEEAFNKGPAVRLMTLRALEEADEVARLNMLPFTLRTHLSFELGMIGRLQCRVAGQSKQKGISTLNITPDDKLFSIGRDGETVGLKDIIASALALVWPNPPDELPTSPAPLMLYFGVEDNVWVHRGDRHAQVHAWSVMVKTTFTTERRDIQIPVSHLVYRQESVNGVIAWVASMTIENETLHLAFKRDDMGFLRCAGYTTAEVSPQGIVRRSIKLYATGGGDKNPEADTKL